MTSEQPPEPLDLVPEPGTVHRRIGDLTRERQLLYRLLRLALAARRERERRATRCEEVRHGE
jgi:hypothetical protein